MFKSARQVIDRTTTSSVLNRRLDSLAYFLAADDACVAVTFFGGRFLISTNDGKHGFIDKCMPFLKIVGESQDFNHQAEKRRELLNEALMERMNRFQNKITLENKQDLAESSKSNLDLKDEQIAQIVQELDMQDDNSISKCLGLIGKLIEDVVKGLEEPIVEKIQTLQKSFTENLVKKAKAGEDLKKYRGTQSHKEYGKKFDDINKVTRSDQKELNAAKIKLRELIKNKISDLQNLELFWSRLNDLRVARTALQRKTKEVYSKLEKCISKFLKSLTCGYEGNQIYKNFDKERIQMDYNYIPPKEEGEPIGTETLGGQLKAHAEMTIIQWIYEKTSKSKSASEVEVEVEVEVKSEAIPELESELELEPEYSHFEQMKENVYIGNCMLACFYCNQAYEALNNFLGLQQKSCFEYRGTHQWAYPGWKVVEFLIKLGLKQEIKDIKAGEITPSEKSEKTTKTILHILNIEDEQKKCIQKELCPVDSESEFGSLD